MALEREGLLDRSDPRRPCLTEAGRARAACYEARTNVVLNHLLYEGLDIDSALHDAYAWALMSSDEGMALIRSSEQRYRAKYELRRQSEFGGAELCRRKMSEDAPAKRKTDGVRQAGEAEIRIPDQVVFGQTRPRPGGQFGFMAAQHQLLRGIGAVIMAGVEPWDQHMAKAQAATADVEEMVVALQPLIKDHLHLMQRGLLPAAPDDVAVFAARQRILIESGFQIG